MKFLRTLTLFLFFSSLTLSQTTAPHFVLKGKFFFNDWREQVIAYDLFENDEKLRMIGARFFQIWDVKNKKVIESFDHRIDDLSTWNFGGISPDKTKLLVLGYEKRGPMRDSPREKIPAKIYDLETGRLVKVLDTDDKISRSAFWSKNGKTLITADNQGVDPLAISYRTETNFSFWDGETFEFRGSLKLDNLTWFYLTPDGENLLTTSGDSKKGWFWIPYVSGKANIVKVWNTKTLENYKNLSVGDEDFHTYAGKLSPSPDGKYLALVSKNAHNDSDHRVLIWDISGSETPKHTIRANPKISDSLISYSPDSKYFALDSGADTQIYELATGKLTSEISNIDPPDFWLDDNKVALYDKIDKLRGFSIPGGKMIFEEKIAYRTTEQPTGPQTTDANGNIVQDTETVVLDSTYAVPSPGGDLFLTYGKQAVKVYDSTSGKILQTLVTPPPVTYQKIKILGIPMGKTRDYGKDLVDKAQWSPDGKMIAILDAGRESVALWELTR